VTRRRGDRFQRVRRFAKGYDRKQVDAFLVRADLALQGALPSVTASEIRQAGFELVRRGYQVEAVDEVLDEMELQAVLLAAATSRRGRVDPVAEAEFLRKELSAPYMRRFPRVRFPRRGYDLDDVDEFVDRVCTALDAAVASVAADTGGLTVAEVRTVAFRPKRGGYSEDAVDEALDRVVEMMLLIEAGARR
jgi:DivIVA domain-containing protein